MIAESNLDVSTFGGYSPNSQGQTVVLPTPMSLRSSKTAMSASIVLSKGPARGFLIAVKNTFVTVKKSIKVPATTEKLLPKVVKPSSNGFNTGDRFLKGSTFCSNTTLFAIG